MRSRLLALFLSLLCLYSLRGEVRGKELITVSSVTYDNSGSEDLATAAGSDSLGNIIVTGYSNNRYLTIKYNQDLIPLQSGIYDSGTGLDRARGIAVDSFNNIIVTGESAGNYFTVKYDPTLQTVISSATYNAGGSEKARAIAVDRDNNIVVTGYCSDGNSDNYFTIKYDANLQMLSSKQYDSGRMDQALAVAVDSQNNIIVTGARHNGSNLDFYTVKYDRNLAVLAAAVYDSGNDDQATGVAVDSAGNVVVTGSQYDGTTLNYNYYTIKYDKDLNLVGTVAFDGGNDEIPAGVVVDGMDAIIVTGRQNAATWNYCTLKYDANLVLVSSSVYDSGQNDNASAVAVDADGNIFVCGSSYDGTTSNYFSVKYLGSPSITSVSSAYQGETVTLKLVGKCFFAGTTVSFEEAGISPQSITLAPPSQIQVAVAVSSFVPLGVTSITVTNVNGEFVTRSDLLEVRCRGSVVPALRQTITAAIRAGTVTIGVPPNTFLQESVLTVVSPASLPSSAGALRPLGSGITITVEPSATPLGDFEVTLPYRDEDVSGRNVGRLAIAYFDEGSSRWVDVPSSVDPDQKRITGSTGVINKTFAIVELPPLAVTLERVKVYPNPYKPGSGTDFDDPAQGTGIVFSDLVPEFILKIFTVAGELVFSHQGTSDIFGRYLWDTKNTQGDAVASGMYIYLIENKNDTTQRAKGKFSIIR